MSSTGQGRLLRSGMLGLQGMRYPVRQETVNGSGLAGALGDYWWGGYPPTPTEIPHSWLTPPANTAAVTRTGGETARSTDRASVLAIGERPFNATLNTTVVDDPYNFATYVTAYYTSPRQRMPELRLNLLSRTPDECWRILSRRIGDRISITGAPAGWPEGVTELVIEGIGHTIGSDDARWVAWKTAPVIGSTPGEAGPWFRLGESMTGSTDLLPF